MRTLVPSVLFVFLTVQYSYCQINIGDTLQFWSVAYIDWQPNPPIEQRTISAVCKAVGEHCYLFLDTEVGSPPTPGQFASLVNVYDTSFVLRLTQSYGPVPDEFDSDPRIYILIIPNEGWVGYFDPAHQMADSTVWRAWSKHSNQKEMVYLSQDAFAFGADFILAHEFGHLLHWGRDHSPEPPGNPVKYWEDAWIDEGFATFAPVYLIEDVAQPDVYDYQAFFSGDPDLSLTYFGGAPSYNQVKLWMTFMYEHFGGEHFISALANDQANGIEGVVNTLAALGYTETFDDSFEQWIVANYLDNRSYRNGKYGYVHYNFPVCRVSASYTQFPTGTRTGSVNSYAADYVRFSSTIPRSIHIHFNGVDTSDFRLTFLKLGNSNSQIYSVESFPLDSLNSATFHFDSLGMDVKQIIMIVMSTDTSLEENEGASYTYSAESVLSVEDDPGRELSFSLNQNYPNPFNPSTKIGFQVQASGFTTLNIYDVVGRQVARLVDEELKPGTYEMVFDAGGLSSGVYHYTLTSGQFRQTRRMLLLR